MAYGKLFLRLRKVVRLFFPSYTFSAFPALDRPTVFVSHHQNLFGPVSIMMWQPKFVRLWVLGNFLEQETCFKQYYDYTLTQRFGLPGPLAWLLAKPMSFFVVALLQSMRAIPVYRGSRDILKTLGQSVAALKKREPVLIFPDKDYQNESGVTTDIYDGFLFLEKLYWKAHREHVQFVPMYSDWSSKTVHFGAPISFTDGQSFKAQRPSVAEALQRSLNDLHQESVVSQSGDVR